MGLMQKAVETYDCHAALAGVPDAMRETLTPISHIVQNAQIEVTIDANGNFISAAAVVKDKKSERDESKTIIPATYKSSIRAKSPCAHPLSDKLSYLIPSSTERHDLYLKQLSDWANSEYSHPKVMAVLKYIESESLLDDLERNGLVTKDSNGELDARYDDDFVRWRVTGDGAVAPCWEDKSLIEAFIAYSEMLRDGSDSALCMITGEVLPIIEKHPKGVVSAAYGAKLISANDSSNFTYRGRFAEPSQAATISYVASQKAHNALRWVVANQGVIIGGRTFVCWNPKGKDVPNAMHSLLSVSDSQKKADTPSDYKKQLADAVNGWKLNLPDNEDVVIASFDAATTGRLSVTYYNELRTSDFIDRLAHWQQTCCWENNQFGYQSPSVRQIAQCAFGVERTEWLDVDDRILKEQVQRLLHCVIDKAPMPSDIVQALMHRASMPLAYNNINRRKILFIACAAIYAYRTQAKKEEWTMSLDKEKKDRSYQFGRLLAVMEKVERDTYTDEGREPNAIRMQSVFCEKPFHTTNIISGRLEPYFNKLSPSSRAYYRSLIGKIMEELSNYDDAQLNRPLGDTYLMGYYLQRNELYTSKSNETKEETEE
ncbi:MAG: type I-C CRISPR-associated protein Cas8c/Csd1 [Oscillospiraceae bacterium]|nr:type I-C CRISPR-associated protein Cas8c/Csd1 [Oscillospiraceae bacterium]